MFVFEFSDGTFYKESGSRYIDSRSLVEHFTSMKVSKPSNIYAQQLADSATRKTQDFKTTNINEAKLFKSKQAIRSSNAYSWGGTIHEVKVNITLVK